MLKSNSFSEESSFFSLTPIKIPIPKNWNPSPIPPSRDILCPQCRTKSLSSITLNKKKESNNYNIKIICKNNHKEEMPLNKFSFYNYRNFKKECFICKNKYEIKKINFCFKCKNYLCKECHCEHCQEKEDDCISNYYGLLENRCASHNKLQEFYCLTCDKYLCKSCLKNHTQSHRNNIINLMQKFNKYEKIIKDEIFKEKNLVMKYNEILNSVRKIIIKNIQRKRMILNMKKSILYSYLNNNANYFNITNIDFAKNLNNDSLFDKNRLKNLYELLLKKH